MLKIGMLFFVFFISLTFPIVHANAPKPLKIIPSCSEKYYRCKSVVQRIEIFTNGGDNFDKSVNIERFLQDLGNSPQAKKFDYFFVQGDHYDWLRLDIQFWHELSDIRYVGKIPSSVRDVIDENLTLRKGQLINQLDLKAAEEFLEKILADNGYPQSIISLTPKIINENDFYLEVSWTSLRDYPLAKIREIKITYDRNIQEIESRIKRMASFWYHKPFVLDKISTYKQFLESELRHGHFPFSQVTMDLDAVQGIIEFKINLGERIIFSIKNLSQNIDRELIDNLHQKLVTATGEGVDEKKVAQIVTHFLQSKAYFNAQFDVKIQNEHNKWGNVFKRVHVNFRDKGHRFKVVELNYLGASPHLISGIEGHFNNLAEGAASSGFYDEEFFTIFKENIQTFYHRKGYLHVQVNGPFTIMDNVKKRAKIEYRVIEGNISNLNSLKFLNLSPEIESQAIAFFSQKVGQPFNVVTIADDLAAFNNWLQDSGYYFSKVDVKSIKEVIFFDSRGQNVELIIPVVDPGKTILRKIAVLGAIKTRNKVVLRELDLSVGDVLTKSKVDAIQKTLLNLGLFKQVTVTVNEIPEAGGKDAELIIALEEREFGLFELSPGIRSDIGTKVSTNLSYVNIGGNNQTLGLGLDGNQRFDLSSFDPQRREQLKKEIEYQFRTYYSVPYFFDSLWDFSIQTAVNRKRYYAFDAEVANLAGNFSRELSKNIDLHLRYQFEAISQENASNEVDNDNFTVGALGGVLDFDFRDSKLLPRKGWRFEISSKLAHPYFLSQSKPDLEVNYLESVLRSFFYFPNSPTRTTAVSIAFGEQRNLNDEVVLDGNGVPEVNAGGSLRTRGRIPGIKAFRLSNRDNVRGFDDAEINRLFDNRQISNIILQDSLYFFTMKWEHRFYLSDTLMLAPFYDTGSLFLDSKSVNHLRHAGGVSFKILTPVGSLDVDYGLKLKRNSFSDGRKEQFGKLHISLGYF